VKLADLRKLAIRRQTRIHFNLRNGMECVITEHGVAQVPTLKAVPDFNLEEELAAASSFQLDPVTAGKKNQGAKGAPVCVSVGRDELTAMASGGPASEATPHEEE
jgi:hypothetical protein